jgi:hypothetical protein
MKRKFKDLVSSSFPDIEVKKFQEWKEKGMSYWKKVRLYYFISMVIMAGALMAVYVITVYKWSMLTIITTNSLYLIIC